MKTYNRSLTRKIAGIAVSGILSAAIYAAATFEPSTQPAVTSGTYALKNNNLAAGTTQAYRPWYENGAWQGDIIEYDITVGGSRTTDASVGSNPPVAGTNNWTARATFYSKENNSSSYWREGTDGRRIFTWDGSSQIPFLWDDLVTAGLAGNLDPATLGDPLLLDTDPYASPILNFIRGDRSQEKPLGTLRTRYSVLGDIINSDPVYVSAPREGYTIPGFATFKNTHLIDSPRPGRVYVGANDGMLHVFDETDGSEVYAYIPSMLIGKLKRLSATPYNHTYYVDGELTASSAQIGGTWQTVLVGGMGAGAAGLFALNITNPNYSTDKVILEITATSIGHIYSRPRVGRLSNGTWHIITGNGYGSGDNAGKLLIISLDNGNMSEIATGQSAGLSGPALVDTNDDDKIDLVFAGDLDGDMWKFDLNAGTATLLYDGDPSQPITVAPAVGKHPYGGYIVYFGTGSVLSMADAFDTSSQAVFAVWDSATGTEFLTQSVSATSGTFGSNNEIVRIGSNTEVNWKCSALDLGCTAHKGWKVDLAAGERLLGKPLLRAGRMQFVTTRPQGNSDSGKLEGDSWLMSLHWMNGGDQEQIVFNLSGDAELNLDDTLTDDNGDVLYPVGLHLGPGNISQPVVGRLGPGNDMMFINGLLLPIPQVPQGGPFLNGHIDVETDSPSGGSIAANDSSVHSEGYNVTENDGLGYGVDGHVHGYDEIHGVNYVDLFDLEPRRGLASLNGEGTGELLTQEGLLAGTFGVVPELNRALNREPEVEQVEIGEEGEVVLSGDATPAPEVFGPGTSLPLDPDQPFILVLANADLSAAGTLQIGCKTWDGGLNANGINEFVQYQNWIAAQLEAGAAPGSVRDPKYGESVVFTLNQFLNSSSAGCPESSPDPTILISFTTRSILDGGIHGTRSQCVLGLHDYHDPVDYSDEEVLCHAENALDPTQGFSCPGLTQPIPGYIKDPAQNLHITEIPSNAGRGYRWRNGALTVQLLAVTGDGSANFTLQDSTTLPIVNNTRFGGTHAQAYTVTGRTIDGGPANKVNANGQIDSGLLYESTIYWHYSDLADNLRRADPASVPCYGDPNWSSAVVQELGGLTLGEYNALINGLSESLINQYADALQRLQDAVNSGDEDAVNRAVVELEQLFADNPDLETYDRYRDYAPGHVPEQHLLDIDKGQIDDGGGSNSSTEDATPIDVIDIEGLDTGTLGPNFEAGRRTWVDIRP